MAGKYGASGQWQKIITDHMTDVALSDLSDFKSSTINYRLALNDVQSNGVRYLKTLIYNLAAGLDQESWRRIRAINGREKGSPISVTYDGESVDLDYLRAVSEVEFISNQQDMTGGRVLEIGAGYGRTCHTILSLYDISEYWIVDLPETLRLAKHYLSAVLDGRDLERVVFVEADDLERKPDKSELFDLCINIDSLAEMDREVVHAYLSLIDGRCSSFYVQNPVGKFLDKSLDGHSWGDEAVELALRSGPLTDVIDIHDNRQVEAQAREFVSAYRPGSRWECVDDAWARPFSHHWQAFYRRSAAPQEG